MVRDDLSWPDGGDEGDCLMAHHKSDWQLLEAFSVTARLLRSGSHPGSVVGNSGNLLKVAIWSGMTWASPTVAVKLLA